MSLTSTISNTIKDLNGTAIAGVSVDILLKPQGAFRIDDNTEIAPKETVVTDVNGTWSINLERTSNISPANSYYSVTEKIPVANGGPATWAIQVGATNQALQAVLITPIPSSSSIVALTQAALDAHVAAADPHGVYQRESEKGVANGYASLEADGTIPDTQSPFFVTKSDSVGVQFDSTVAEVTLATVTFSANYLKVNDIVVATFVGKLINATTPAVDFTFGLDFGGTNFFEHTQNIVSSGLFQDWSIDFWMAVRSAASQKLRAVLTIGTASSTLSWKPLLVHLLATDDASGILANGFNLEIKAQMSVNSPLVQVHTSAYSAEVLRD